MPSESGVIGTMMRTKYMMSNNRRDYDSAQGWLSALREDELWLCQAERLQAATASEFKVHRDDALRRIGQGDSYEYWELYQHRVEPVVVEVWSLAELSLTKLKIQVVGMLKIEWLEQKEKTAVVPKVLSESELWQRVKDAGFVDENGQPTVSRTEAAIIADMLADRIGIKNKWKFFENFWRRKNMRNDYNKALDLQKSLEYQEKLKKLLA